MGEMNEKLQNLSKGLLGLHVKDVFSKKKDGLKLRNLSDDDKEKIRNLFKDLEQQVNDFVSKTKEKGTATEAEAEGKAKKTRTTLRDRVRKNKR
ncbi:hypothetical protein [Robertmurraya andreesenii]|uniref:Spore coat protein n=1 Tax=Anoxybacillus andreesenii TaxID=1325932 RepID=A0ABT9V315_9BACL|nr:hypothetical protein [Robertmurraya andreesenii]MDQ0155250.1 hypothetical protein [Robertmurraya andreesenii]